MNDEHENERMKEATNELASFLSNLGSVEMPIEEYVQLAREEIVDTEAKYVDLTWDREIPLGLDLVEEPMKGTMWITGQH